MSQTRKPIHFLAPQFSPKNRQLSTSKSSCLLCEKTYFWGSWKRRPVCLEFKIKPGNKWVGQSQKSNCVFLVIVLAVLLSCVCMCVYTIFQHVLAAESVRYYVVFAYVQLFLHLLCRAAVLFSFPSTAEG